MATTIDRRKVLRACSLLPLLPLASGRVAPLNALLAPVAARVPFVGNVEPEPGSLLGAGLNGRRVFDLSRLVDDGLVVGNDDFFVRTRAPESLRELSTEDWRVRFDAGAEASGHFRDFGGSTSEVSASELADRSRALGRHLIECSGNSSRRGFGLISVAEWSGVPLSELFASAFGNTSARMLVRVTGRDDHQEESQSSVVGASWIFTVQQLREAGAFLATGMNGRPLPADNGGPVRLVMPGWYGCCAIKWVESIEIVTADTSATSQMREFASRTHQDGRPELASDYLPAEIDFAAMPILVEGLDETGGYQVTGVAWGNSQGVESLHIRYRWGASEDAWLEVDGFVAQEASSWTLWRHVWRPRSASPAGTEIEITMRVGEKHVRTRRLDRGAYARRVVV